MLLSVEEVLRLSPDEASAKAAKGLVVPAKWPRLEFDGQVVWGECQGSGAKPYQVQVDRSGPAFRCTCPSRKFPCKHGLALLLLLVQNPDRFARAEPPAWVGEWLSSRQQRAEKQELKKADASASGAAATVLADPQAAARREAARVERMGAGLEELERWLSDRLRQGLAQLPNQPGLWQEMATRMVDAQLPGLASRLRRAGGRVGKGEDWPARVLADLGKLRLLIESFRRIESLPPGPRMDVRAALGLTQDREAVLAGGERLADDWLVLGQGVDEEDRLWARRVWLQGRQSGRQALLLDYAHGARRFEPAYVTGACLKATLVFYPGNSPLRALVLDDAQPLSEAARPAPDGLDAALETLSRAVAANPWQWPRPLLLGDGVPRRDGQGWALQDAGRRSLGLRIRDADGWRLMAESGGAPLALFGEWDGDRLRPLSVWNPALVWSEGLDAA